MTDKRIRVLLVDDHAMVAEGFRRLLDATGDIEVVAMASTAVAAAEAAVEHRPDVVLMDYRLPDGPGTAAAARIRAEVPGARVIMLTGSDEPDALRAALAAGCVGYLEKTGPLDRLPAAIRAAAAGESVISPHHLAQLSAEPAAPAPRHLLLTRRELEILRLVAEGMSNQMIADAAVVSIHTVRTHIQAILEKVGAHSKLEAVTIARRQGLLGPD
ncbi:MAG TPA: response regulator transcription factor [Candidatus Dormibacteraeota bacterium]|nr:response regulator transcription factor [Candidatus Dormibacteraeota bacterium]